MPITQVLKVLLKSNYGVTKDVILRHIDVNNKLITMKNNHINNEEVKNNSKGIIQSKRMTWNTRRKYNYKYITTVF